MRNRAEDCALVIPPAQPNQEVRSLTGRVRLFRPAWVLAALLALSCTMAVPVTGHAMGQEKKITIYIVYQKNSGPQKAFVEQLFKNFNKLGFTDRMKKKGVSWVEASFGSSGPALHIGTDDIIYFGVLMTDGREQVTREMFRARVQLKSTEEKKLKAQAEQDAHLLYYGAADVLDTFLNKGLWQRQVAMCNAKDHTAEPVRITVEGKPISGNNEMFPIAPFKRTSIGVAMVPSTPALWKRLGAEGAGSAGKGTAWIKKGTRRILFEVGSNLLDTKTWVVSYQGGTYRKFVSPINPLYAYAEVQGDQVLVPLALVIKELGLPYDVKNDGATVVLTRKGKKK